MKILPALLVALVFVAVCAVPQLFRPTEVCNYEIEVDRYDGQKFTYTATLLIREFDNDTFTAEYVDPFK